MDVRTQRSLKSAEALLELLREVIVRPTDFANDSTLYDALKSQGELSKFGNQDKEIHPSSINTLKRIANDHMSGGWSLIDGLRKEALAGIERHRGAATRNDKGTQLAKAESLVALKLDLQTMRRVNLVLLRLITQTLEDLSLIRDAKSNGERNRVLAESLQRAKASLISNQPPFDRAEGPRLVVSEGEQ